MHVKRHKNLPNGGNRTILQSKNNLEIHSSVSSQTPFFKINKKIYTFEIRQSIFHYQTGYYCVYAWKGILVASTRTILSVNTYISYALPIPVMALVNARTIIHNNHAGMNKYRCRYGILPLLALPTIKSHSVSCFSIIYIDVCTYMQTFLKMVTV